MNKDPDITNVLYMDEYRKPLTRPQVHQALGQLTLLVNANPDQLRLFVPDSRSPE